MLLVAYVSRLQEAFRGVTPTVGQWVMMAALVQTGTLWMEARKLLMRGGNRRRSEVLAQGKNEDWAY